MRYLFPLLFLLLFSCRSAVPTPASSTPVFNVSFHQAGHEVLPQSSNLYLNKAPFRIDVELYGITGLYLSASWGTFHYDFPPDRSIFNCHDPGNPTCRFPSGKTLGGGGFNERRTLAIGDADYHQYWSYVAESDWHRFDPGVTQNGDTIRASFTVERIEDLNRFNPHPEVDDRSVYPIEQIEQRIFLVFAVRGEALADGSFEELGRRRLQLWFE